MPRSIPTSVAALAIIGLVALSVPASGQTPAPPAAATCATCHGTAGISGSPTTPNLAGQKAGYLEAQLKAFKAVSRTNPIMNPIAGQLGDDDIHVLALYWASLPATPAAPEAAAIVPSTATLPAGFPNGFVLYQTKPPAADGSVTKRYANALAFKATKAGQPLPVGSAIVAVTTDKSGAIASYETMESRAGWGASLPPLLRNGGFQFAHFDKTGQMAHDFNQAACLACHKAKASDSYMFSHQALVDAKG